MQVFEIKTLIDITQTGQTKFKSKDRLLINQQANWNTFLQVLSMRINPIFENPPQVQTISVNPEEFGNSYVTEENNKHKVWHFKFTSERDGAVSEATMQEDFDLIPVINGLSETILNSSDVFRTRDVQARNIVFKLVDNIAFDD